MSDQDYVETCVFCKVGKGLVRADIVYEDPHVVAFKDIHPQAPVHVLIIPRNHITALWEADETHAPLLGHMLIVANEVAEKTGITNSGYRVVANAGPDAGQSVDHVHFHVMGGRTMEWPPG